MLLRAPFLKWFNKSRLLILLYYLYYCCSKMKREFPLKAEKAEFVSKLFVFFSIARYNLVLRIYSDFFSLPVQGILILWSSLVPVTNYGGILSAFTQGFDITQQCWAGFCWLWSCSELNTFCQTPAITQELHTVHLSSSVVLAFPGQRKFKIRLIRIEGLFLACVCGADIDANTTTTWKPH